MPAPPPESDPAIVNAIGVVTNVSSCARSSHIAASSRRRRLNIIGHEQAGNDRHPVGTRTHDIGRIAMIDAGNPHNLRTGVACTQRVANLAKTVQADGWIRIVLARGCINSANTVIVRKINRCRTSLGHRMDREPDQRMVAKQVPGIIRRHVILADMNALRAACHSHVNPVVDHQRNLAAVNSRQNGARLIDHVACRAMLVAQLQKRSTAPNRLFSQNRQIP